MRFQTMTDPAVAPGDVFGRLVALEPVDAGRATWRFRCTCGVELTRPLATVRASLRSMAWASCPECFRKAGGKRGVTALTFDDVTIFMPEKEPPAKPWPALWGGRPTPKK